MRIANCLRAITFVVSTFALVPNSWALTELYYTSSPESWVGHGETVSITPQMNFSFLAKTNYFNGVDVEVNDFATNPDVYSLRYWDLSFSAPNNAPLTVGTYSNATRYPFNNINFPGSPGCHLTQTLGETIRSPEALRFSRYRICRADRSSRLQLISSNTTKVISTGGIRGLFASTRISQLVLLVQSPSPSPH